MIYLCKTFPGDFLLFESPFATNCCPSIGMLINEPIYLRTDYYIDKNTLCLSNAVFELSIEERIEKINNTPIEVAKVLLSSKDKESLIATITNKHPEYLL